MNIVVYLKRVLKMLTTTQVKQTGGFMSLNMMAPLLRTEVENNWLQLEKQLAKDEIDKISSAGGMFLFYLEALANSRGQSDEFSKVRGQMFTPDENLNEFILYRLAQVSEELKNVPGQLIDPVDWLSKHVNIAAPDLTPQKKVG